MRFQSTSLCSSTAFPALETLWIFRISVGPNKVISALDKASENERKHILDEAWKEGKQALEV